MPTRRSLSTPAVVVGCALAAALLVVAAFLAFDVGGSDDGDRATEATPAPEEATSTPLEDRLTSESRLGYAGLGPIKVRMSAEELERAGRVTIMPSRECSSGLMPEAGSGLQPGDVAIVGSNDGLGVIIVRTPSIRTISGVHVGSAADDVRRTYPNVVETPRSSDGEFSMLTITNPEGRYIRFIVDGRGVVSAMQLYLSADAEETWGRC